ncbi:MAG: PaaI family thioesterase [Sandaracinaceae bacterium]|nr:PaaI family thioesterase [Sandaracinaceae bacterium]
MTPEERAQLVERMNEGMWQWVPHNRELGLHVLDFRGRGEVWMKLPYAERLVGNPETGILHGGAITSLMDAASGMAVMVKLGMGEPIATLDLRIDYLKPAAPRRDVTAHTEIVKVTKNVVFVRGIGFVDDEKDPVASVAATFMRKGA